MNNKKITILFILIATIALLGIVGFTIAYFTSSTDFENEFNTAFYQTEATETFTSPQNWMPGDETPKTLTITNTGNVDVKARVCITEEWTSDNGDTLPNKQNGEKVAIINLDNTSDWTKKGNCYEYNDTLEPNDTTSSFIESVTFNPNVDLDITCTTTTNNGSTTKTCGSTGDGYDNATYTLTLRVETVQANAVAEAWPDPLQYVNRQVSGEITTGDEIAIDTEHFYVVSSDSTNTVLLAKYNLLVGLVLNYDSNANPKISLDKTLSDSDPGYGLQSSEAKGQIPLEENETTAQYVGTVPFSGTNYWDNSVCQYNGNNNTGWECTGNQGVLAEYGETYGNPKIYAYRSDMNNIAPDIVTNVGTFKNIMPINNGYTIAYYVENYIDTLKDLGAPNSVVGRLISYEELVVLGCNTSFCSSFYDNESTGATASDWVYSTNYWAGSVDSYRSVKMVGMTGKNNSINYWTTNNGGVRPVIEIPTSELE